MPFRDVSRMKRIGAALEAMMPSFQPLGTERRMLTSARGFFLAEDVMAKESAPAFSNSAMDGYAVRAEDLQDASEASPKRVFVAGEARAGSEEPPPLPPGAAIRIFTGAPMPSGSDSVVMQEQAEPVEGQDVHFRSAPEVGQHVRHRGSDVEAGSVILCRGQQISGGEVAILASQRVGSVSVFRKPRVAILSTGDELVDLHDQPVPNSIVNSNAYLLAALVEEAGGVPTVLPKVADSLDATIIAMEAAFEADLVLTSGGVSVGEYDYVKEALAKFGVEAGFWKVKVKPGKPLTFGVRAKTPIVGLPGNPVSAFVTFETFVRPGLLKMQGSLRPFRPEHQVRLSHDHKHSPGRPELARGKVKMKSFGWEVTLHPQQGSGSLPSMVDVDALVMLPEGQASFRAGESLCAVLLREGGVDTPPFSQA